MKQIYFNQIDAMVVKEAYEKAVEDLKAKAEGAVQEYANSLTNIKASSVTLVSPDGTGYKLTIDNDGNTKIEKA